MKKELKSKDFSAVFVLVFILAVIVFSAYVGCTPGGRACYNNWFHAVQKADDETNYATRKQVEDTCRAMISSYKSDKLMYEQYRGSDDPEESSWADQAKLRANKTAVTYNDYVLMNSYLWKEDVPPDIRAELPIIE